ncbi:helix-turn-helix domain-containing protein [Flavobacterium columnare]|uniref:helix-turn-helix domain-containing protein n=1 Tax=Flavobacterium columnare TaxID=996 RepID=UPI003BA21D60
MTEIILHFTEIYPVSEDKDILKTLGENIKKKRQELKLSQEALSFDANIPRTQLGRIERGEINTTVLTLYKISEALKIELAQLLP